MANLFGALFTPKLFIIRSKQVTGRDSLNRPITSVVDSDPIDGILRQTGTVEGEAYVVNEYAATFPLGTVLHESDEVIANGALHSVEGRPVEAIISRTRIGVLSARLKYVGPVT